MGLLHNHSCRFKPLSSKSKLKFWLINMQQRKSTRKGIATLHWRHTKVAPRSAKGKIACKDESLNREHVALNTHFSLTRGEIYSQNGATKAFRCWWRHAKFDQDIVFYLNDLRAFFQSRQVLKCVNCLHFKSIGVHCRPYVATSSNDLCVQNVLCQ